MCLKYVKFSKHTLNHVTNDCKHIISCALLASTTHCSKSSFFVQKFNFDFPRKLSIFGWKTRESVVVLDLLTVDNFDFTRKLSKTIGWKTRESVVVLNFLAVDNFDFKIVKKNLAEKLVKMLGFCQIWIFGQKFDFSNSVYDKNTIDLLLYEPGRTKKFQAWGKLVFSQTQAKMFCFETNGSISRKCSSSPRNRPF